MKVFLMNIVLSVSLCSAWPTPLKVCTWENSLKDLIQKLDTTCNKKLKAFLDTEQQLFRINNLLTLPCPSVVIVKIQSALPCSVNL